MSALSDFNEILIQPTGFSKESLYKISVKSAL